MTAGRSEWHASARINVRVARSEKSGAFAYAKYLLGYLSASRDEGDGDAVSGGILSERRG